MILLDFIVRWCYSYLVSIVLENPTKLRLPNGLVKDPNFVKDLKYTNTSIGFQLLRWKKEEKKSSSSWFVIKYGIQALRDKIKEIEDQANCSAIFKDSKGFWTYSGLAESISKKWDIPIVKEFTLPKPTPIKFKHILDYEPRDYQLESTEKLISAGHGAVELATGTGKSTIIALCIRDLGRSAVVVAPTTSIANQLFETLSQLFTTKLVGKYYGGKKQPEKFIVVGTDDSLRRIKTENPHWDLISQKEVLLFDESHLAPASSLESMCMKLFENIPYRFFYSGTQTRNDGLELVLEGITSSILHSLPAREAIAGGYISPIKFFNIQSKSLAKINNDDDPLVQLKKHLRENKNVYDQVKKILPKAVSSDKKILILIDHVKQFKYLLPCLDGFRFGFAHGGVTKDNKSYLPQELYKSNPMELVKSFDGGEFPILVGTSCISTGTDIKSTSMIIDLVMNKSEIRARQAVGRGTRLFPNKKDCMYFYFNVENVPKMKKYSQSLTNIFKTIGPVSEIRV